MSDASVDKEQLFDILGNDRRRACLEYLRSTWRSREGHIDVSELATQTASKLADDHVPDGNLEKSVYTTLCQTHLEKLDRHGIVNFDEATKRVSPGPAFQDACRHLDESTHLSGMGVGISSMVLSLFTVILLSSDLLTLSRIGFGQVTVILLNLVFLCALGARYLDRPVL